LSNGRKTLACDSDNAPWLGVGTGGSEGRGTEKTLYQLDGQRVSGDSASGAAGNEFGKDIHEILLRSS
jgi:hypothetical protein